MLGMRHAHQAGKREARPKDDTVQKDPHYSASSYCIVLFLRTFRILYCSDRHLLTSTIDLDPRLGNNIISTYHQLIPVSLLDSCSWVSKKIVVGSKKEKKRKERAFNVVVKCLKKHKETKTKLKLWDRPFVMIRN